MNRARAIDAVRKGGLAAIGVALIATGGAMGGEGQLIGGGILAGLGAVLLMVSNYVGR